MNSTKICMVFLVSILFPLGLYSQSFVLQDSKLASGDPSYVLDLGITLKSLSEPVRSNLEGGLSILTFEIALDGEVNWKDLLGKFQGIDEDGLDGEIDILERDRAELAFYFDSREEIAVAVLPSSIIISTHYPVYPQTTETAFDSQYALLSPTNIGASILTEHAMEAWVVPLFKGIAGSFMDWVNKGEDFKKAHKVLGTPLHTLYMWGTLYRGIFCGTAKGLTLGTYELIKNAKSCFETGIERTGSGDDERAVYAYFDGAVNAGLVIFNIYSTASLLNGTLTPVATKVGNRILASAKNGFNIGPLYPGGLVPELAGSSTVAGAITSTGVAVFDFRNLFFAGLRKGSAQMILAGGVARGVTGSFSKPKITRYKKLNAEERLALEMRSAGNLYKKCVRLASDDCKLPLKERVKGLRNLMNGLSQKGYNKTGSPFYNVYCNVVRMKIRIEIKLLQEDIANALTRKELKGLMNRASALEQNFKYLHEADVGYYSSLTGQLKALAKVKLDKIPKKFDAFLE